LADAAGMAWDYYGDLQQKDGTEGPALADTGDG